MQPKYGALPAWALTAAGADKSSSAIYEVAFFAPFLTLALTFFRFK
jgi:hypothetical protein